MAENIWEELNKLNEDTPESNLAASHAHEEGGLKCPYCGSTETVYTDTEQEADPDKDGAGGVGVHYVERHKYQCNNCMCKFYTYTETIILKGTEIYQDGIDDDDDASIILDEYADMYGEAASFDVEDGLPWEEFKDSWYEDLTDEEIKKRSYEFNGLWYEGEWPDGMSDFSDDEESFVNLSNKIHELDLYVSWNNTWRGSKGTISGKKEDLKEFIDWCASESFQPFYDGDEYWRWKNDNDEDDSFEFAEVYR